MKPILEIQNVSKKFRIRGEQQPYLSLRDSLGGLFSKKGTAEDFWALNGINLTVMPGDTLGIIGKNGAGKSTLLKILSKITPPTSGKIISRGRIASLLEVGTGFHPELSGRENIFLNGSILGMKRAEIQKQFDAIIDFAGVDKFMDTPLKHYSSGMQLRLAFAVAAFLEPEILIIDEVLAVGDAEFQKKCMGKMSDVSNSGRTILFVSHNMGAVAQLCKRGILLKNGSKVFEGGANELIDHYLKQNQLTNEKKYVNQSPQNENFVSEAFTCDANTEEKDTFSFFENIHLLFKLHLPDKHSTLKLGIAMQDKYERRIFSGFYELGSGKNDQEILLELPHALFAPGTYTFTVALLSGNRVDFSAENICPVTIVETGSELAQYEGYDLGCVIPKCNWKNL